MCSTAAPRFPRPPTRRLILGATLAAPLVVRAADSYALDSDVVVVGAGAAGIGAAHTLIKEQLSVTVLEARPRLGGRTFTDSSLGVPFDAGAAYIHWSETNPWVEVARNLGIEVREENTFGSFDIRIDGRRLTPEERMRRSIGFQRLRTETERLAPGADLSFASLAGPEGRGAARGLTLFSLGEEPERASVRDYDALWAGSDMIAPEGYGTLVARYGAGLPVRLATPVTRIVRRSGGVELATPAGTITAQACIVTVPLGVLAANAVQFDPGLPTALTGALERIGMGALTKIVLRFDDNRLGLDANTDIFTDESGMAMNLNFWPQGKPIVMAILGGDAARTLCNAGEKAALDAVTTRISAVTGVAAARHVTGGRLAGWWADPYARGSYSVARPGGHAHRLALRDPIAERIFLAGEHTAEGGAMTAGGALLEGRRAADAVIRLVRRP